jgi:hypothetical protein
MSRLVNAVIGGRVQKFGDFYSQAIERAVRDPVYAKSLVDRMANKPMGLSDTKALRANDLETSESEEFSLLGVGPRSHGYANQRREVGWSRWG